ncbi:hypothetical protein [Duganella sp. CF458]|uniref:hypothetical protein n=1 Tax=Duganella sp. CF458 TaxID=1884368 RepID=UPI000B88B546|nr:hypothetical protein [Duganella sp. CF458]
MFKLSHAQYEALRARDSNQFVDVVCDQFLESRPELAGVPGRTAIYDRMFGAFNFAKGLGFRSTPHVIRLMYLSADAPGIHADPVVSAHLRRPGASPEQRLDDLLAVVRNKLKGMG